MATNERGASICRRPDGSLVFGPFATGTPVSVNVPIRCPPGAKFHGIYHTHPDGVPIPSGQDLKSGRQTNSQVLCISVPTGPNAGRIACYRKVGR